MREFLFTKSCFSLERPDVSTVPQSAHQRSKQTRIKYRTVSTNIIVNPPRPWSLQILTSGAHLASASLAFVGNTMGGGRLGLIGFCALGWLESSIEGRVSHARYI